VIRLDFGVMYDISYITPKKRVLFGVHFRLG
jgi:hypothetical protein